MRGKSTAARRALLHSVSLAKKAKLENDVSRERNALQAKEQMLVRNIEDKM